MVLRARVGKLGCGHDRRFVSGEHDWGHRGRVRATHQRRGRQCSAAGERKSGVIGNLHPHRRRVAKLVGNLGELRRRAYQVQIPRGVWLVAEPGHQRVERGGGFRAGKGPAGQEGGRCVLVPRRQIHPRTHDRQRGGLVVHHQHGAGPPRGAHQGSHRLRLRQHRDVVNAGVFQRPPQLVGFGVICPAQPGSDQPVALVGEQSIRADHGLGQRLDRLISEIDDGLVDHVVTRCPRRDKRQAGNGAGDRNPQNDVHRGSPSAGHPAPAISSHHYTAIPSAVSIAQPTRFAYTAA